MSIHLTRLQQFYKNHKTPILWGLQVTLFLPVALLCLYLTFFLFLSDELEEYIGDLIVATVLGIPYALSWTFFHRRAPFVFALLPGFWTGVELLYTTGLGIMLLSGPSLRFGGSPSSLGFENINQEAALYVCLSLGVQLIKLGFASWMILRWIRFHQE